MLKSFIRWRHGRGFGVHSPLAFELIYNILRDAPRMYADETIRDTFTTRRQRRIARIFLRLISHFEPESVYADCPFNSIVALADTRAMQVSNAEAAVMALTTTDGKTTIRYGFPDGHNGPLILDNENDLIIEVYRVGLSPTLITTTL